MSRYPRWLTLGQTERMRQLEEAGWTFSYGKNPDVLDVLYGMRVTTKLSDTLELWKDPEATSMLRRWRENEGPHLHPTRVSRDEPLVKRFGSIDTVLTEALDWLNVGKETDEP